MGYVKDSLSKDEKIIAQFKLMSSFGRWGTEYAITNKRIITKTGLIARNTDEMKTDAVESVLIKQGVLGRISGYGDIIISGRGSNIIVMKEVADVLKAKRTIESALPGNTEN